MKGGGRHICRRDTPGSYQWTKVPGDRMQDGDPLFTYGGDTHHRRGRRNNNGRACWPPHGLDSSLLRHVYKYALTLPGRRDTCHPPRGARGRRRQDRRSLGEDPFWRRPAMPRHAPHPSPPPTPTPPSTTTSLVYRRSHYFKIKIVYRKECPLVPLPSSKSKKSRGEFM
ncbi:hypothetical protein E2C01_022505 [Portunus trituberculatus]|uniref:Uncharacterized protein n=1 Tax=Portunus trituberculatus TaxID=210409 RepID=A0A5B7E5K0_PORTR|nr:hypothetical protein [Portunus trituberculatus]